MSITRLNVRALAVAAISLAWVVPVARAQAAAPRFPMPQGPRVTSP